MFVSKKQLALHQLINCCDIKVNQSGGARVLNDTDHIDVYSGSL